MKFKLIKSVYHKDSFFYSGARFFERMAFYGLRSFLIIYLVESDIALTNAEAATALGAFISITYISSIAGGLIGDHYGNRKIMFIAVIIQIIGSLLFLITSTSTLYLAIIVFSAGSGLYIPNLTAQLARANLDRKELLDSTFTLIYFLINFAAMISPYIFYLLFKFDPFYAFSICSVMLVISLYLLRFTETEYPQEDENAVKNNNNWKIVFSLFAVFIFFLFADLTMSALFDIFNKAIQLASLDSIEYSLTSVTSKITMIVFPLIALIWSYLKMRTIFKYMIGFYFSFMAYLIFATLYGNLSDSSYNTLVLAIISLSLAEILIVPLATANLAKFVKTKNFATLYSLLVFTIPLGNYFSSSIRNLIDNDMSIAFNLSLMLSLFIFFLLGLVYFLKRHKIVKV